MESGEVIHAVTKRVPLGEDTFLLTLEIGFLASEEVPYVDDTL